MPSLVLSAASARTDNEPWGDAYFSYINDRQIKLVTCDDQFNPEIAISCFNSCLKDKVFAGAFFIGSSVITKYIRMCDVTHTPMIGFNVGPPALCEPHPTLFNLRPCYGEEVSHQVKALWQHGVKKIAILYQADALGAGMRETAVTTLKELHAEPVAEASFSRDVGQVEDAYNRVKKAQPQAILAAGSTLQIRKLIEKRKADNWSVPYVIMSTLEDPVLETGTAADGIIMTGVWPSLDSSVKSVELYKQLLKKYFPTDKPHPHGFEAFVNAMVLVEALKRAGHDLTRSKLLHPLNRCMISIPGCRRRMQYRLVPPSILLGAMQ